MAFFGFLRVSEFTVPTLKAFNPHIHPSAASIHWSKNYFLYHLKDSKTDQFSKGHTLHFPRLHNKICPYKAMARYFKAHKTHPRGGTSPLFTFANGRRTLLLDRTFGSNLQNRSSCCKTSYTNVFALCVQSSEKQLPDDSSVFRISPIDNQISPIDIAQLWLTSGNKSTKRLSHWQNIGTPNVWKICACNHQKGNCECLCLGNNQICPD